MNKILIVEDALELANRLGAGFEAAGYDVRSIATLKEAEEMNHEVAFNGYFLKKLRYPAADKSKFLEAPVLIGPTVSLTKEPPAPTIKPPLPLALVASVLVVIVAVGGGLVLLGWYFRRGDQALKQRLAQMQAERTLDLQDHEETARAQETNGFADPA